MTRFFLHIAIASFVLLFSLLNNPETTHAQSARTGTDEIRFMAATRGIDYDNDGKVEWCWVMQETGIGWHGRWMNGLDEVPQQGAQCPSNLTESVDLATYGLTDSTNCTISVPCYSLKVIGLTGTYGDGCDFTEADLYDYGGWDDRTLSGDWKGKQRLLHVLAPHTAWIYFDLPPIMVTQIGWYQRTEVGMVTGNWACPGFSNYHVHHDSMPSTGPQQCQWRRNTSIASTDPAAPGVQTDWEKENVGHWVHSLVHSFGVACVVPGPDAANWLLRSGGGELDDTGAGTRQLAETQQPIQAAYTCFTQSSWCGIMTVSKELLVAAKSNDQGMSPIDYFNSRQQPFPPTGVSVQWYGPDSGRVPLPGVVRRTSVPAGPGVWAGLSGSSTAER